MSALSDPTTSIHFGLRLKWIVFRMLERASQLKARRGKATGGRTDSTHSRGLPSGSESLWVFVSTIGELNAIDPFLRELIEVTGALPLTLITDRQVYRDSYHAKYPNAFVYETDGTTEDVYRLYRLTPPRLLVIAEIPCLPSDAPCRFPFGMVYTAKRRNIPVCLVNGWLYEQQPSARLDRIERQLFERDYVRLMDLITVQTEETRERLLSAGAREARVFVTGNTKFDAMSNPTWSPANARSPALLEGLVRGGRPCIVAGCVTDFEDQALIVDAFEGVLRQVPTTLLILVPRHPENLERLEQLVGLLKSRRLTFARRSHIPDTPLDAKTQCLVLDTMGELKDFYAVATTTYVGRDHNLLEPLAFDKPVTISPGWERRFPSYPVYRMLLETGAVTQVASGEALQDEWLRILLDPAPAITNMGKVRAAVDRLKGASKRNLELMQDVERAGDA